MKIYTRYFAFSLFIFSSALCHAALQNGKVQVAITKGQSTLINPQDIKEPIASGKLFEQGYKVETSKDSTVELCLSNGSTVLVNPETLVEIRTFRQVASSLIVEGAYQKLDKEPSPSVVEIFVVRGKIIGEVRKLNPQSSFTIKSPAGVARIRGTVYSVEYNKNKSTRTGNMEVACVKGSVEVTVNGSNSGPVPVEPGRKMNAQAPIVEDEKDSVPAVPVKIVLPVSLVKSPQLSLPSTEGLVVGDEIKGPGIPSGVKIESIEDGKIKLNTPITLDAGTEVVFDPPPGATYVPATDKKENLKKGVISDSVTSKNVIKLEDSQNLKPGMKIRAAGFPVDVEVVSVDPITHEVTLSVPVTVNAGTEILPVTDVPLPPAITNPTITITRLGPDEIKTISDDIGKGTSLPPKLKDEVKDIADKTPPLKPTAPKDSDKDKPGSSKPDENKPDGNKPDENKPESTDDTTKPPTNGGGSTSGGGTGGINNVIDAINNSIQETIEKEEQKNPSPTGG